MVVIIARHTNQNGCFGALKATSYLHTSVYNTYDGNRLKASPLIVPTMLSCDPKSKLQKVLWSYRLNYSAVQLANTPSPAHRNNKGSGFVFMHPGQEVNFSVTYDTLKKDLRHQDFLIYYGPEVPRAFT